MTQIESARTNRLQREQADMIRELWGLMGSAFGNRWVSSYGETDYDGIWAMGLSGLTRDDLIRGVGKCVKAGMDWPPSLPEFRQLCEPDERDLGLPTMEQAYNAAARRDWSIHPAVYHAAKIVGVWDLEQKPEYITRPQFAKAWATVVERVRNGEQLPGPIEAPRLERKPEMRREVGRNAMANIKQMLHRNQAQESRA